VKVALSRVPWYARLRSAARNTVMDDRQNMRDVDRIAYPGDLEAAEATLIRTRRSSSAGSPPPTDPAKPTRLPDDAIGFGLSGGGVRSATFCLGVFQSLAEARLLRKIDFVSTVSGGGYFGSFLGRLFTRDWVHSVDDVESAIRGNNPPSATPETGGWANRMFRWLRDNGRYLAPRGSGDLILLGAILLRNWIAVQVVMIASVLAVFVSLQLVRPWFDAAIQLNRAGSPVGTFLTCTLPGGNSLLLWSPWIVWIAPILVLGVAPTLWAYWLVTRRGSDGAIGIPPMLGVFVAMLAGVAGATAYRGMPGRFWPCALLSIVGLLTVVCWLLGQSTTPGRRTLSPVETGNFLRTTLSRWLKNALLVCGAVLGWTLLDTAGGTLYVAQGAGALARWSGGVLGVLGGIGAFGRTGLVLLTSSRKAQRPRVSASIASWSAAVVVVTVWLVTINALSHAVASGFNGVDGVPAGFAAAPVPKILGADRVDIARNGEDFVVSAAHSAEPPCVAPSVNRRIDRFGVQIFVMLLVFSFLFGRTRTFANLSTLHAFYSARLTRTFLGASNPNRLAKGDTAVKETLSADDCEGRGYWNWPSFNPNSKSAAEPPVRPWTRGSPLHIINTTVNETMDALTKVQNQDRKGTGLALGPCGLSLGIRHHLVADGNGSPAIFPLTGYRVFRSAEENGRTPDSLSVGRWMSISGAAFSAAAGANTTVPVAILAGMLNVRLGYWWDSGTPAPAGPLNIGAKGWTPWVTFEALLPVQSALLAEMLARTRGTAGPLWNLSDGGHFENMGGYELIRRRLPLIVIVDAEADPDYEFQGLSDLVRKARLDFNAEIKFLSMAQFDGRFDRNTPVLPNSLLPYFGDLGSLRRGRWLDETAPGLHGAAETRYALEVDRSRVSRAHAALATIAYGDTGTRSWLVYVKATLTGDEPEDVCHYHRAHPAFPQETTNDQFFDEAQWESYRRLGLHIGHRVLTPELFDHLQRVPPPA
jgi:hypothetical protein